MKYIRQNLYGVRYEWMGRTPGTRCLNQRNSPLTQEEARQFASMERAYEPRAEVGSTVYMIEGLKKPDPYAGLYGPFIP
jgi:hypothetical protein